MLKIAFPHKPGSGGPGSFQIRFERELKNRGFQVVYPNDKTKPDLIFIIGGTNKFYWLLKSKKNKIPIVYRLDGINWLHRKRKAKRGIKGFILKEIENLICKCIHAFIADFIIYQSQFVKNWWHRKGWIRHKNFEIIHNGVDLNEYFPKSNSFEQPPALICLEGNLDYSPYAIRLMNELSQKLIIEFKVYGGIKFGNASDLLSSKIKYLGFIERRNVPLIFKNAIYLSLDVNAACPNTVIEALSCGAPVVGFDTGSLSELVTEEAGLIVPYKGNPWRLDYPDVDGLLSAIGKVCYDYKSFSQNARKLAIAKYSIDNMMDKYLAVLDKIKNPY